MWGLFRWYADAITPEPLKQRDYIRAKLLYHTNHEELLRLCRQKLAAYNKSFNDDKSSEHEIPKTSQASLDNSQEQVDFIMPGEPGFATGGDLPKRIYMKILDLNPTFVKISKRYIDIEMCTGFYSISILAFPEGIEGYGDLKLIDGLWYFDAGFDNNPGFSDYLEKLKQYDLEELKR